jgi:hypothetical protein
MKTNFLTLLLLLVVGLLSWTGCEDDEPLRPDQLSYDGPNFTSPQIVPGVTVFAAYFPPSETQPFAGRLLDRISFDLLEIPNSTSVVIYEEGTSANAPGNEIYRVDLSGRINNVGEIIHRLPSPIEITADGIWIGVEVEVSDISQSVGCDQGENYNTNGDRILTPEDPRGWTSFNALRAGERVNWNIRGILADE